MTPRYEPSWFYEDVDPSLLDACMRPRRREALDVGTRDWLHKQLVACGHEANGRGHHFMAHAWFECAYMTKVPLLTVWHPRRDDAASRMPPRPAG